MDTRFHSLQALNPSWSTARPLLIVGASARAAAASASRAGWCCHTIDLFGDADLRRLPGMGSVQVVTSLSDAASRAEQMPAMPWLYTGGMENRPDDVHRISQRHWRRGCSPETIRQVRAPTVWSDTLQSHGIAIADIREHGPIPPSGRWLIKPIRSCGGLQLRMARPGESLSRQHFAQAFVPGWSCSASFLAGEVDCTLVGCCEQFTGQELQPSESRLTPYQYAGSVLGPDSERFGPRDQWETIGYVLWQSFGLRGLFGVDAIVTEPCGDAPRIIPVEINPRYTASMELLEWANGTAIIPSHLAACQGESPSLPLFTTPAEWFGKFVVYAHEPIHVDKALHDWFAAARDRSSRVRVADIPTVSSTIPAGAPVVSVLIFSDTRESLLLERAQFHESFRQRVEDA